MLPQANSAPAHFVPARRNKENEMEIAVPKAIPKSRRMTSRERRSLIQGLLFISPWLFGFVTLTVYPLLFSFYISLTRYDLIGSPRFIGLANYYELFFDDPLFWNVMYNTLY
jgi:multiple sugar transport system permease protein